MITPRDGSVRVPAALGAFSGPKSHKFCLLHQEKWAQSLSRCQTRSRVGAGTHPGGDVQAPLRLHGWTRHPRCSQAAALPNLQILSLFREQAWTGRVVLRRAGTKSYGALPFFRVYLEAASGASSLSSFGWTSRCIQAIMYRGEIGTSFCLRLVLMFLGWMESITKSFAPSPG